MNEKQIKALTEAQKVIKVEIKYHYRLELMAIKFSCCVPIECRKWVTEIVGIDSLGTGQLHYIPAEEKQILLLNLLFNDEECFTMPMSRETTHISVIHHLEIFSDYMLRRKNKAEHIVLKTEISEEEFLALRDFLEEDFKIKFN